MSRPALSAVRIGQEREPVIVLDDFAADAGSLRRAAREAGFGPAGEHYPGVRADLPPDYLDRQMPLIARALGRHLGKIHRLRVVDARFAMVTTPPDQLSLQQRLPHVDAHGGERIAMVHYLSDHPHGTAFYRHRATGWETIGAERAPRYNAILTDELGRGDAPPAGYLTGDTALFERIHLAEPRMNRALLYRSHCLHSGDIPPAAELSADPEVGRLTVTGFFIAE